MTNKIGAVVNQLRTDASKVETKKAFRTILPESGKFVLKMLVLAGKLGRLDKQNMFV